MTAVRYRLKPGDPTPTGCFAGDVVPAIILQRWQAPGCAERVTLRIVGDDMGADAVVQGVARGPGVGQWAETGPRHFR